MTGHQSSLVAAQFGGQAAAYVAGPVHATGADLQRLTALVQGRRQDVVLDLGCGGGHVSYAVAADVARVVACDLSPAMLDAVAREASRRSATNIEIVQAQAEDLPFPNQSFDWVISRYSAHHWHDLPHALARVAALLRPGGTLVMIDLAAPADPKADTFLQSIELLRDPSHVRSRSLHEWRQLIEDQGPRLQTLESGRLRLELQPWLDRMATSAVHRAAIVSLQRTATSEVAAYFEIADNGDFSVGTVFLLAARPDSMTAVC